MKNGKAGGIDNNGWNAEGRYRNINQENYEIIQMIWDYEEIPTDWLKGLIVKIPKKGNQKAWHFW